MRKDANHHKPVPAGGGDTVVRNNGLVKLVKFSWQIMGEGATMENNWERPSSGLLCKLPRMLSTGDFSLT